jgi:hypothetical protein
MTTSKIIIFTGHYGSGKTNLAINCALDLKMKHKKVMLVDLDIVNPFFRSKDFQDLCDQAGILLVAPEFAGSNVDLPFLPSSVNEAFYNQDMVAVFDIGGDDAGAIVLSQYHEKIKMSGYQMLYVINQKRLSIHTPDKAQRLLQEIETASRLRATGIINNTNLGEETIAEIVAGSVAYANTLSVNSGLDIVCTSVRRDLADQLEAQMDNVYPIDIYTHQYW